MPLHCHFSSGTDSERTVTLEVGAGVTSTPTVATVPCPRSVGFSLFQIDFSLVGESTTFLKRQLPRRSIIDFSFFLLYAIYFAIFCKLYVRRSGRVINTPSLRVPWYEADPLYHRLRLKHYCTRLVQRYRREPVTVEAIPGYSRRRQELYYWRIPK
jgi:hypothetical protein